MTKEQFINLSFTKDQDFSYSIAGSDTTEGRCTGVDFRTGQIHLAIKVDGYDEFVTVPYAAVGYPNVN